MAKWKYKLSTGAALRTAIDDNNNEETLQRLKKCYEEIHKLMSDVYEEEDLYEDLSEIDNQLDNLENYEDYDMTLQDCEDEINYLLSDFYDFCDNNRIWVGLNF